MAISRRLAMVAFIRAQIQLKLGASRRRRVLFPVGAGSTEFIVNTGQSWVNDRQNDFAQQLFRTL
jgi:hypothetical protein